MENFVINVRSNQSGEYDLRACREIEMAIFILP